MFIKAIFLVWLLVFVWPVQAELYKCTVADKITYQDKPCPAAQTEILLPIPSVNPPAAPAPNATSTPVNATPPTQTTPAQFAPVIERDAQGNIKRSEKAKADFKAANPCPGNGHRAGACPGYVIDHIVPLACGGADSPANMQWQTVPAGKEKDRWERTGCTPVSKNSPVAPAGKQPITVTISTPSKNSPVVHIGARGGRYIITPNGKKRYLKRK